MTDRATAPRETPEAARDQAEEARVAGQETPAPAEESQPEAGDRRSLSTADLAASGRGDPGTSRGGSGDSADTVRGGSGDAALFDRTAASGLQRRWHAIQVEFVDEPRGAVEKADGLVAEVMQQLAESFATERKQLEAAWSGGREASTEDLRQAIRRYRSFFNRLLSL